MQALETGVYRRGGGGWGGVGGEEMGVDRNERDSPQVLNFKENNLRVNNIRYTKHIFHFQNNLAAATCVQLKRHVKIQTTL